MIINDHLFHQDGIMRLCITSILKHNGFTEKSFSKRNIEVKITKAEMIPLSLTYSVYSNKTKIGYIIFKKDINNEGIQESTYQVNVEEN